MTTIGSTKGLSIVFAVVLAVVVCAGAPPMVQPTQAKTDESSILPETISASLYHTCGVRNDGTLACWGTNCYGQSTPPGGAFSQVSAGTGHSCGVKSDGMLACWGLNDDGQSYPYRNFFPLLYKS